MRTQKQIFFVVKTYAEVLNQSSSKDFLDFIFGGGGQEGLLIYLTSWCLSLEDMYIYPQENVYIYISIYFLNLYMYKTFVSLKKFFSLEGIFSIIHLNVA